jgi:type VI secretion system protein ImpC
MSNKSSFGTMQFDVSFSTAGAARRRDPEACFNLAIAGDFSGRSQRGVAEPIGQRRIWRVDCDNFDEVMGKLEAKLGLWLSQKVGDAIELPFRSIEDFHPDQLLKRAAPLAALLQQRRRLLDPSTRAAASAELQATLASKASPQKNPQAAAAATESNDDTLARLLGGTKQTSASAPASDPGIKQMIQNIVAPSIVAPASAQETALLSVIDLELATMLRSILHHPDFQALEAAWRGIDLLVRNFGAEENLKIYLVDISKKELAADLQANDSLESSGICKLIARAADDQPWTVWLGQYTFGDSLADIETLGRLAKVSARTRAPFISGGSPHLAGCDAFASHPDPDDWKEPIPPEVREAWESLRKLPEAAFVGLALPRFLLRQPYGKESDPIDAFPFEELSANPSHESYLWGNASILCGYILAAAFQAEGWEMKASGYGEVGELPVYTFEEDGETKAKPCGEAWLNERAGSVMIGKGLMPVLSIRGRDAVRVAAIQSLAGGALPIA